MTAEQTARLHQIRQRVFTGTVTREELQEGFVILRADRVTASNTGTAARSRKAAATAPLDAAAVLSGLQVFAANLQKGVVS